MLASVSKLRSALQERLLQAEHALLEAAAERDAASADAGAQPASQQQQHPAQGVGTASSPESHSADRAREIEELQARPSPTCPDATAFVTCTHDSIAAELCKQGEHHAE